ncbi:MAG TPA: hypothetical protein ENG50_01640 [Candidatus Altiarchaeales archaeon]|nr:hypothetical protein [Candidatus Altiarchaeales archaeon]
MPKEIVIRLPEWIDESTIEEASKILLQVELRRRSPKGLLKEIEKFEPMLTEEDIRRFLEERR